MTWSCHKQSQNSQSTVTVFLVPLTTPNSKNYLTSESITLGPNFMLGLLSLSALHWELTNMMLNANFHHGFQQIPLQTVTALLHDNISKVLLKNWVNELYHNTRMRIRRISYCTRKLIRLFWRAVACTQSTVWRYWHKVITLVFWRQKT